MSVSSSSTQMSASPSDGRTDRLDQDLLVDRAATVETRRAAVRIVGAVVCANVVVWAAVYQFVLKTHEPLVTPAILAYSLGLRHALDADHISAIDLTTRRLLASGRRPVTVGLFFSLGHSTVVFLAILAIAVTATAISSKFDQFAWWGAIVGSAVSTAVLLGLGIVNFFLFVRLKTKIDRISETGLGYPDDPILDDDQYALDGRSESSALLLDEQADGDREPRRRAYRSAVEKLLSPFGSRTSSLIDQAWKMYPLGFLFGLGFDTSSEVSLIALSAVEAMHGTPVWLILILPVLFAAGMSMIDTADGAGMMSLYTTTALASDMLGTIYYSAILTGITVLVAMFVGSIQMMTLIDNLADHPVGIVWDVVRAVADRYDLVGLVVCLSFLIGAGLAFIMYRPWRARLERRWAEDDELDM